MIWFCGSYINIRNKTMYRICGKGKNKYIEQVFFDGDGNPISVSKGKIIKTNIILPNCYRLGRGSYKNKEVCRRFLIGENDTVFEYINNCDWLDEVTDKNLIDEIIKCKDIM